MHLATFLHRWNYVLRLWCCGSLLKKEWICAFPGLICREGTRRHWGRFATNHYGSAWGTGLRLRQVSLKNILFHSNRRARPFSFKSFSNEKWFKLETCCTVYWTDSGTHWKDHSITELKLCCVMEPHQLEAGSLTTDTGTLGTGSTWDKYTHTNPAPGPSECHPSESVQSPRHNS